MEAKKTNLGHKGRDQGEELWKEESHRKKNRKCRNSKEEEAVRTNPPLEHHLSR